MAFDGLYDGEEAAAKPPISLHPAFPAIVALWFAALLGVGTLVLPPVLLEKAVVAAGLPALIPAASPPLGFTARGLIAIVATIIGTGLGIAIARRVANAHGPKPLSRIAKLAEGSRRPISVREELGGEGVVNGQGLPISRRRALAISEDDRPSDFLYRAPLPGHDPDDEVPFRTCEMEAQEDEAFELNELAEEGDLMAPTAAEDELEPDFDEEPAMTDRQEFQPVSPFERPERTAREFQPVDERDVRKNLAGPRGLEPLPFSPPSLTRRAPEPEPAFEPSVEPVDIAVPATDEPEFRADWETAPLDGLGLVQLVQRLGSTIERRREMQALATPAASEVTASLAAPTADLEPAPAEEAVLAMAAFFSPDPEPDADQPRAEAAEDASREDGAEPAELPRPGFLRQFDAEFDEDDDGVPDFSLPLRSKGAKLPPLAAVEQDEQEDADGADEGGYSSLLGMSNPFAAPKGEFVRIEEPEPDEEAFEPAVVFPGREEASGRPQPQPVMASRLFDPPGNSGDAAAGPTRAPADADAALRSALATLQRMSGAA
jgi:hypothetical protein